MNSVRVSPFHNYRLRLWAQETLVLVVFPAAGMLSEDAIYSVTSTA
jgi:hypothetical protein